MVFFFLIFIIDSCIRVFLLFCDIRNIKRKKNLNFQANHNFLIEREIRRCLFRTENIDITSNGTYSHS